MLRNKPTVVVCSAPHTPLLLTDQVPEKIITIFKKATSYWIYSSAVV
ncbi:MAG: hypothetical protein K5752_09510 [Succinivibrionaceae bacterium]|nr:hypothetical protein [Succinivibrionaceae bacterium]